VALSTLEGFRFPEIHVYSCSLVIRKMTSAQIRQSFLDFFREKQHTIVPSSSLLPDAPNLLFTNAGMNQFVPIFLGQQKPMWVPPRAADTQKCIRAGGKHNDLEDVGLDTYHHTFFEMLGNWSFGDYFKKEAIEWAWELLVERWKFPPQRLYATVYKPGLGEPSEFDQEAYNHWARLFREADLDPKVHVLNGGKADNFWMMGDTGPCGPCSEVHVDLTPDGDTRGALVNKNDPRCIEIWNLVFIQFNAQPVAGGGDPGHIDYVPLAARHVDTGMGFERVTAIIQGTKNLTDFSGTISNYETDIFRQIFDELEKLSGKRYAGTLPIVGQAHRLPVEEGSRSGSPTSDADQEKIDIAFRVIADHIRALSLAIADGIIPSNEGRGYVLRRILRRAVSYGRDLGIEVQFLYRLVSVVVRQLSNIFPNLAERSDIVQQTIRHEEDLFSKTVQRGFLEWDDVVRHVANSILSAFCQPASVSVNDFLELTNLHSLNRAIIVELSPDANSLDKILNRLQPRIDFPDPPLGGTNIWLKVPRGQELSDLEINDLKRISGKDAFKLYDTYGFPLDLVQIKARELGLTVDVAGFERLMEQQRERARKAQKKEDISVEESELQAAPTKFLGYDFLEVESVVETVLLGKKPDELNIVLDRTPFYAEMGGQVGDRGLLHVPGHDRTEVGQLRVIDTQKRGDVFVHRAAVLEGRAPEPGEAVRVSVDVDRRRAIQGHHTVTHLLHWALHEVVSRDASQKGSYVGPDKLTFDFSGAPLTKQQVRDVEKLVNEKITENATVSWTEIPYADARKRTDIIQFFGEKYGDTVRVLQIGGAPRALNGYSMELCGGTHVRSTGDIGPFRIVKEEAIAAGIRRVEAVAGDAARNWANQEAARQQEKFEALERKKSDIAPLPPFENDATASEMLQQIDARTSHLEKVEIEVRDWEKQNAKTAEAELRSRAAQIASQLAASHAGENFCVAEVQYGDGKLLQAVADTLKSNFSGPIFLVGAMNGSVALVASVPKEMTSTFQANKLIQQIAPIVGGKGGGRPENAQGAGKDASKVAEALAKARELLS
jgi:alanyl-tRNA synthetase